MKNDPSIDPSGDQVRQLRDTGPDGPFVMVNLLKFRDRAQYDDDRNEPARSGREAYALYEHVVFSVAVHDVGGAEIVYQGPVNQLFIGPIDDPATDWDEVLLVRYPSKKHFLAMLADDTYRAALVHRQAALERTFIFQCDNQDGAATSL